MRRWSFLLLLALPFCLARAADGEKPMTYIYHRDFGDLDERSRYMWRVLRETLEHTRDRWGDYVLEPSVQIHQRRRVYVLEHHEAGINVSAFPTQPGLEGKLEAVRIPVDRGLLGYRVMLIRAADQPRFSAVRSIDDLKDVRFGLLGWWEDVAVMRNAGLTVVPGTDYDGLFRMLVAGRFDALSRSASEVLQEYDLRSKDLPGIVVERHFLLHYPMPVYFWFPNSEDGLKRAERVRVGLSEMERDGSLQALFDEEFAPLIKRLDLDHRLIIEVPNPSLSANDPLGDKSLWYRPHAPGAHP